MSLSWALFKNNNIFHDTSFLTFNDWSSVDFVVVLCIFFLFLYSVSSHSIRMNEIKRKKNDIFFFAVMKTIAWFISRVIWSISSFNQHSNYILFFSLSLSPHFPSLGLMMRQIEMLIKFWKYLIVLARIPCAHVVYCGTDNYLDLFLFASHESFRF